MPLSAISTDALMLFFFVCAVFGSTMMFLQLVLMLIGFGGDVDADGGDGADSGDTGDVDDGGGDAGDTGVHGHSNVFDVAKVLSIRTIVAGFAFFGLGGLWGMTAGLGHFPSVLIAIGSGIIAIYIVYYLYLSISRIRSDGSISEKTLVGSIGNVYVRIPSSGNGAGKVLVTQQDRTMEYEAITSGEALKTGTPIVVIRVVSPTTVEVKSNE